MGFLLFRKKNEMKAQFYARSTEQANAKLTDAGIVIRRARHEGEKKDR